jgi:hypothetical protein
MMKLGEWQKRFAYIHRVSLACVVEKVDRSARERNHKELNQPTGEAISKTQDQHSRGYRVESLLGYALVHGIYTTVMICRL